MRPQPFAPVAPCTLTLQVRLDRHTLRAVAFLSAGRFRYENTLLNSGSAVALPPEHHLHPGFRSAPFGPELPDHRGPRMVQRQITQMDAGYIASSHRLRMFSA
jgi:hypothetical protein